jgi:hypothetical protein
MSPQSEKEGNFASKEVKKMKTTEKLELLSPTALTAAERNPRKHTLR